MKQATTKMSGTGSSTQRVRNVKGLSFIKPMKDEVGESAELQRLQDDTHNSDVLDMLFEEAVKCIRTNTPSPLLDVDVDQS